MNAGVDDLRGSGDSGAWLSAVNLPATSRQPVVVGGVGGSGTRLVAQALRSLGYHIGLDRNEADDNLWHTLLFTRREIVDASESEFSHLARLFAEAMSGRGQFTNADESAVRRLTQVDRDGHSVVWLRQRADTLLSQGTPRPIGEPWGWKEPNTHIIFERLSRVFDGMKYIFVSRHGLDMAFSANQNQARLWGPVLLGEPYVATPRYSLRYWCAAHRRLLGMTAMANDRFHWLKYDDFCRSPRLSAAALCCFLGVDTAEHIERVAALVRPSPSIGRFACHAIGEFDADDVAYVESLGFDMKHG